MDSRTKFSPLAAGSVSLGGIIGRRMDLCIDNRVAVQEIAPLVQHYRDRSDGPTGFRGEFWGKWFTSLLLAGSYRNDEKLRAKIAAAVEAILATQTVDGCISTYDYSEQHGMWDVWSRKYVLLGLVEYYESSGDKRALRAAEAMVDHFMTQVGPGKISLADCGHWAWKGLPPSSILEPVAKLYRLSGREKYLELCEWIIDRWSKPSEFLSDGLRLIESALDGKAARDIGNPKAYEQMSCFEGLCELYIACGQQSYLDAAVALAMDIRRTELTVVGSGSNQEMWCDGARHQALLLEQPQETCATATWLKLCYRLLTLTGSSMWADEMEKTLYNALSAAMSRDGSWWVYYAPLAGERVASHFQYEDLGLSCCVASGPRAMLLTHRWAYMRSGDGVVVNFYGDSSAQFALADGSSVKLNMKSDYPVSGDIEIEIDCDSEVCFELRLRIPAFSQRASVTVDGESYTCEGSKYFSLHRNWQPGQRIQLSLDMRGRAISHPDVGPFLAVARGPLVLALDSRLAGPERKSMRLVCDSDGYVDLKLIDSGDDDIFMACEVPFTYHKVHIVETDEKLIMCDYASAGNLWSADNLYRVWLAQPLFMDRAFPAGTWRLTYPENDERPDAPVARNDFQ